MVEDTWTFPRFIALQELYAEEGPPIDNWAAAYFKFKGEKPARKRATELKGRGAAANFADLKAAFGGA